MTDACTVRQGGEALYDSRGYPICPGDLLRAVHFIGARRRVHYLYHVAVMRDGTLWRVPTSRLDPSIKDTGGTCRITDQRDASRLTILDGSGPGEFYTFEQRERRKAAIEAAPDKDVVTSDG